MSGLPIQANEGIDCAPGSIVVKGILPNCYAATEDGGRNYTPGNSDIDGPVLQMHLPPDAVARLGAHTGVRYKMIIEPIPPNRDG